MKKVLVISVGGTPDPIIESIRAAKPDLVVFFVSRESRSMVSQEVLPRVGPLEHDFILTPDHEDLEQCYDTLRQKAEGTMPEQTELVVDYTGGTKTMSAALALWALTREAILSYIGGHKRDEHGRVVPGTEEIRTFRNPWQSLAFREMEGMIERFNASDFAGAERLAQAIHQDETVRKGRRDFAGAVCDIARFFHQWDNFNYSFKNKSACVASDTLEGAGSLMRSRALEDFGRDVRRAMDHYDKLGEHHRALGSKNAEGLRMLLERDGPLLVYDLVANALRRAKHEGRYDDAAMRLYSALEKLAKTHLLAEFGLDNSRLDCCVLKEKVAEPHKYESKIGLVKSYELLEELGSPLGLAYRKMEEELKRLLDARNFSFLIHGVKALGEEGFVRTLGVVAEFLWGESPQEEGVVDFVSQRVFVFPQIPGEIVKIM